MARRKPRLTINEDTAHARDEFSYWTLQEVREWSYVHRRLIFAKGNMEDSHEQEFVQVSIPGEGTKARALVQTPGVKRYRAQYLKEENGKGIIISEGEGRWVTRDDFERTKHGREAI